jgi:hypothetical protein
MSPSRRSSLARSGSQTVSIYRFNIRKTSLLRPKTTTQRFSIRPVLLNFSDGLLGQKANIFVKNRNCHFRFERPDLMCLTKRSAAVETW